VAIVNDLRWSPVAGADRYRVTVSTPGQRGVRDRDLRQRRGVPRFDRLVPDAAYLWKVDARTGFDRWVASDLVEFRVAGPRRR